MFQYIMIHRILHTDGLLHKMNMIDYPTCPLKFVTDTQKSALFLQNMDTNFVPVASAGNSV